MAHFMFLHSSYTGAWCWRDILPRLESKGHTCIAPDMPAGGTDPTPPESVTFEDYVRALIERIQPLPEPVILVGHSRTSIISQVAERIPSQIRALVYVAGVLLPNGMALILNTWRKSSGRWTGKPRVSLQRAPKNSFSSFAHLQSGTK
jgi:pimeloyl-ACP methyl ester carboxylesterase